jgi:enoyl-CoA hydratase/carnithine racemase
LPTNTIRVIGTIRDDVLYIDLANPQRHNAIDTAFTDELIRAPQSIESVRVVLLGSRCADFRLGASATARSSIAPQRGAPVRSGRRADCVKGARSLAMIAFTVK